MGVHARAAVTPADGTLVVEDLVLPDPAPYQVVVRLFASGICHSQLTDMKYSQATNSPMTLGHEATGEIVAVGSSVTTTGVGDRVFVTWLPRDGGPLGRRPDSPVLTRADGSTTTCHNVFTWADHTICDEQFVVPLPADMPTDLASIVGCAVMTGAGAVLNTADVQRGQSVAVFGVGGVGISAIVAASARGASPIIAVDLDDAKLEWALRQGASHTVNAARVDAVRAIHELTADPTQSNIMGLPVSGAHYAFDCIGGEKVVTQLLPSCRSQPMATTERGTAVMVGIVTLAALEVNPADLIMNEKRLVGCIGGSSVPARDFPIFCDWVRSGRLKLDEIVTQRVALDDIAAAAEALDRGEITGRAILTF